VATGSHATPTLDALMHQADEAMYRAKENNLPQPG
jgi:GGDEF domain-containing protein